MQTESNIAGDIFAWLFLIALFAALFGLPTWLMIRHYKKSKPKIEAEKKAYEALSPIEKEQQKNAGFANLAGVTGLVIGVLIGSRVLDNVILGILLGAILGALARYLAESLQKQ